jgi:ribosomal protein S18 acetylase RimI-like enzyme
VIERRTHHRSGIGELLAAMSGWPHADRVASGLHPGDLGWHLRLDDSALEGAFVGWWDEGDLLAVGLVEGAVGRFSLRPGAERDGVLGEQVARACRELENPEGAEVYADLRAETATRRILVGEGWALDPEPWVALHTDLETWAPAVALDGLGVVEAADAVPDRVAVQRAGFEGSTFTEEAWHRMAAGPGYRRDLDLVVVGDGRPASVATGWWAGQGATAILEPVATHRDHRGHGWGVRAVTAVVGRLRDLGASGVSVCTPLDNVGAVAAYRAAGLRPVEQIQSLVRQPTS